MSAAANLSDINTFYEGFLHGLQVSGNGPCLGTRTSEDSFTWITYAEALEKASNLGSGFIQLGQAPVNSTCIGIYAKNREEFVITQLACSSYSMCLVPMYDTLGPSACASIIEQAELHLVVCDTNIAVKNLLIYAEHTHQIEIIVSMSASNADLARAAKIANVQLVEFNEVMEMGKFSPVNIKPAKPADLLSICYTSGTTGDPKGVMLAHSNIFATVKSLNDNLAALNISPSDVMISYLPLQHIYEAVLESFAYTLGVQVGFYRGDAKQLLDDVKVLQPTVFPTVPRLLNKIHSKVMDDINARNFVMKKVFSMALTSKYKALEEGIVSHNTVWDKLVFYKVQRSLGGRCRLISCGACSTSPSTMRFIRAVTGALVLEGYGQTECAAICSMQRVGEYTQGNVGHPIKSCQVKVIDVDEMKYFADQGRGEVGL